MPEETENGYIFPEIGNSFLDSPIVKQDPESTIVTGFACDIVRSEKDAMRQRSLRVIQFAYTLKSAFLKDKSHCSWAEKLHVLAISVPDQHGLLIPGCISQFPSDIASQLCPNHCNWEVFKDAICQLEYGVITVYKPWTNPADSELPIELNRFVPPMWRGANPNPNTDLLNKEARAYVDDSDSLFTQLLFPRSKNRDRTKKVRERRNDYDDPPEKEETLFSEFENLPSESDSESDSEYDSDLEEEENEDSEDAPDPGYSHEEAFRASGLRLVGFRFHLRKMVLDLDNCILEKSLKIHPLLHTSFQPYTLAQWERLRGFKIAFAIIMRGYALSFNSHDNNTRITWRTKRKANQLQKLAVPDPVLDYFGHAHYTAKWLQYHAPRSKHSSLSIYQWLTEPGSTHNMLGVGSYTADELLAKAGIPPDTPAYAVLNDPTTFFILFEANIEILLPEVFRTKEQLRTSARHNAPGEFTICVTHQEQIDFAEHLWVHGKKQARVSPRLYQLIQEYNGLAQATHSDPNIDLKQATRPFDLANIRHACLLWGHLGLAIVGSQEYWDELLANEAENALKPSNNHQFDLRKFTNRLPDKATELQRLALTPITMLDQQSKARLEAEYGTVHHLVQYFRNKTMYDEEYRERQRQNRKQTKAGSSGKSSSKVKQCPGKITKYFTRTSEPQGNILSTTIKGVENIFQYNPNLHLLPEPGYPRILRTRLFKVQNTDKTTWTLFDLPLVQRGKSLKSWKPVDEAVRIEKTISELKTHTKGWGVGWPDFCGHAQVFGEGVRGHFVSLCRWDPGLTPAQRQRVEEHWEKRGLYDEGMRKLPKADLDQERNWRISTKKRIIEDYNMGQSKVPRIDRRPITVPQKKTAEEAEDKREGTSQGVINR
ncbi:hypothetical protein DFH07DRAFT_937395 [Mycena maculata]|uniref:Uncharacterized protein n=1 Tax=Mycena maculata TaxID=230809 RepID=A0AAD7JZK7_9AGAR|nr:hypothetical protein DFH07DRAFT_937395 [Mycena maculata]